MNSIRFVHFGIAMAAVAALSAGTAYALLDLRARAPNSRADAELSAHQLNRDSDGQRLLDWISVRTMPLLDQGIAVHELGAPGSQLTTRTLGIAGSAPVTECQPHWRPLIMGPAGREVANICPGLTLSLPSIPEPQVPPKLTLPSIGDFNWVLRGKELGNAPDQARSASAGLDVLKTLQGRFTQLSSPRPRTLPFVDPLRWSVAPRASANKGDS